MISTRMTESDFLALPAWQREEARHYFGLCEEVERLLRTGRGKTDAIEQVAEDHRSGIHFECDRKRVLRPTAKTLWRKFALFGADPRPEALARRYHRGGKKTAMARRPRKAAGPVYDREAFLNAVIRRCFVPAYESLAEVMDSFAADYAEGRKLPGVSTDRKRFRSLWLIPGVSRRRLIKEAFTGRRPALKKQLNTYLYARKIMRRTEARLLRKLERLK